MRWVQFDLVDMCATTFVYFLPANNREYAFFLENAKVETVVVEDWRAEHPLLRSEGLPDV